jgi:chromosome segregation ATPase
MIVGEGMADMSDKMDLILQELMAMRGDVHALQGAVQTLQDDMQTMKGTVHMLQGAVEMLQGDMHTMKGAVQTLQDDMQSMKGAVQTLQDDMQTFRNEMHSRMDRMDARLDQHEAMIEQLIQLSGTAIQNVQMLRDDFEAERKLNLTRHETVVDELAALRSDVVFTYEKTSRNELEIHRLQTKLSG